MVDSHPDHSPAPDAAPRARAERAAALDAIFERLPQQFPELSAKQITDAIRGRHAEFDNNAVRDPVPVLLDPCDGENSAEAPRHRA